MDHQDVEVIKEEILHRGYLRLERLTLKTRLFAGTWSNPYTRELVKRMQAVAALPYDPVRNKVVLIEQFRVGALWIKESPWLLELVAGVMDKDEKSEDLIRREAREEAGLEILDLLPICRYLSSPGGSSEEVIMFCAKVDATKAPKFCGLPEENEDIRVHILDVDEAFSALHFGKIINAATIIALQWLELNLVNVRNKWKI
jgi:ADP-ribose pyrophosphatase